MKLFDPTSTILLIFETKNVRKRLKTGQNILKIVLYIENANINIQ